MTTPLEVDHLSWACRVGGQVSVRLSVTGAAVPSGPTEVELTDGRGARLRAPAEATPHENAVVLAFTTPQISLGSSAWQLSLRTQTGVSVPISTRLLAAPGRPAALLPGPAPDTRLRPPAPRRPRSTLRALASQVARRLPAPVRTSLLKARDQASRR